MASKEVKIKKLVIELSGKDVELTLTEAKELRAALNELLEEKVIKEKEYIPQPYPVYPRPWISPWRERPWITWCDSDIPVYTNTTGTAFQLENNSIRCQLKA